MTYIFYDTETTGVETEFDQILQFAAIKTDDDFNELESFELRSQLIPYIVPAPSGLLTTRIPIATLIDKNLPTHYEFIKEIRKKLLEWSPGIFVGYNSISFDEELMRHTFFQTLHPPYLTNTGGNRRVDLIRIAHATSVYAPQSISVPKNEKGKSVFKLKNIAVANGYVHDNAHEALADVRMTIQIAKLIKEKAPSIWQNMIHLSKKADVFETVSKQPLYSLTEYNFGNLNHYIVSLCGMNGNIDAIVFDLKYNPDDYISMSTDELVKILNGKEKPIRPLNAHKQPILMPIELSPIKETIGIDTEELTRRAQVIKENIDFQKRIQEAMSRKYENKEEPEHLEERLYSGGFVGKEDEALILDFQNSDWEKKLLIAEKLKDERVREFAYRVIFLERPDLLPTDIHNKIKDWKKMRLSTTDNVPWMTIPKAIKEIEEKLESMNENDLKYLMEIKEFIEEMGNNNKTL